MNAIVRLHRLHYTDKAIFGTLMVFIKGQLVFSCMTLERPWLNNRQRVSAVPAGTYPLVLEYSPKFRTRLWELYDVPGRSEAKVHAANFASQLEGCIAVGRHHIHLDNDGIPDLSVSKTTLDAFHKALSGIERAQIIIVGNGSDSFTAIPETLINS